MVNKIFIGGGQTGDEGKGAVIDKVIHILARNHDQIFVVRAQGGANAGHTLRLKPSDYHSLKKEVEFVLHLLPSGVAYPNTKLVMEKGMVAELSQLDHEIKEVAYHLDENPSRLKSQLFISKNLPNTFPYHRIRELAEEDSDKETFGESKGSTGRGIGSAYKDVIFGKQITMADFLNSKEEFKKKIETAAKRTYSEIIHSFGRTKEEFINYFKIIKQKEHKAKNNPKASLVKAGIIKEDEIDYTRFCLPKGEGFDTDEIVNTYWELGQKYKDNFMNIFDILKDAEKNSIPIFFEGAQGSHLSVTWGIVGNNSSSDTGSSSVQAITGIPLDRREDEIGLVFKAYSTKVGNHVYVARLKKDDGAKVGKKSLFKVLSDVEFGATTGRQRMVGWFDLVEARKHVMTNNANSFYITKLDMLSGADKLKICIEYKNRETGEKYTVFENDKNIIKKCDPVYKEFKGWKQDISNITAINDLPEEARDYINFIREELGKVQPGIKLRMVTVGKGRKQYIRM